MKLIALVLVFGFLLSSWVVLTSPSAQKEQITSQRFIVSSIGRVTKEKEKTHIVLDKRYQPGLLGLDGFSHIYVY
ncbi:MAG: hypothetical protein JW829_19090, partial [Pirellulales bacterium]|nr:hypothetical protein [Pirellulales bacterium]